MSGAFKAIRREFDVLGLLVLGLLCHCSHSPARPLFRLMVWRYYTPCLGCLPIPECFMHSVEIAATISGRVGV
jgi:hypothetical protein